MPQSKILVYLVRRDLRVSDNPVLSRLATSDDHGFTHLLPVFVFPAHQMELSGLVKDGAVSPYPEARSQVGGYWRCGPHRAKFVGEAVWNLKESLEALGSGLVLRAGMPGDVIQQLLEGLHENEEHKVGAVWMIGEEGVEEEDDERAVSRACKKHGVELKVWVDEKYFVDDRDLSIANYDELPDVFTSYRKLVEPLREKPRPSLPRPPKSSLPPLLDESDIPPQSAPFTIPETYADLEGALLAPVKQFLPDIPPFPEGAESAHPFRGGEDAAQQRLHSLLESDAMLRYKETRNGLLGTDFSTKLSAFLAQGCVTARQIHEAIMSYEDGTNSDFEKVSGYGEGENEGTKAVRFELLWRDYMRLCTRKFKHKLFRLEGFRGDEKYGDSAPQEQAGQQKQPRWKTADKTKAVPHQEPGPDEVAQILHRFNTGMTGLGLIDASQRELIHTGYTSNRARQNVAGLLAKHLGIDWRYGAEWYEMMLVDYDVCSNWANWQYVAGVGNDPRGEARIFNPVKQAFDYDKDGAYVRAWVPELRGLDRLENLFQVSTTPQEELGRLGLQDNVMVTEPVKRIEFSLEGKPRHTRMPGARPPPQQHPRRGGYGSRPNPGRAGGGGSSGSQSSPSHSSGQRQHGGQPPTGPAQQQYPRGGSSHGYYYEGGDAGGGYYRGGGYRGRGGAYHRGRGPGGGGSGGRGAYRGRYGGQSGRGWTPAGNPDA